MSPRSLPTSGETLWILTRCPTECNIEVTLSTTVGPILVWTVIQIGVDTFVNEHHQGRNESVDKNIVEEILLRPELQHLDLIKRMTHRRVCGIDHRVIDS